MPNLQTPPELAEEVANWLGIYGACPGDECTGKCRPCFVTDFTDKIRQSVKNEELINSVNDKVQRS